MERLISPDGDEVLTTESGVEALKKAGYKEPPAPKKSGTKDEPGGDAALKKMKLAELLEHAKKAGVAEETLAELGKPGTSKAQVIEAITTAQDES